MTGARYLVVGGAGFIGGHLVDHLLGDPEVGGVTVYDNFSSGRRWHLDPHRGGGRLLVHDGDVRDLDRLVEAMWGHQVVVHLASNPDIARAASDPAIDFREGTQLTHHVVEAMRMTGAGQILYASGSGVYGDLGPALADEDHGPLLPISTYGASKLAGEALISAYCHMFGLRGCVFRFANVVGARQTHGVGFDFLRQLRDHPSRLRILGDGTQSKSYLHISDVIRAVRMAAGAQDEGMRVYNVATGDHMSVREIAELAVECAGLPAGGTEFVFTGGDRGWRGDVPVVRLNTERIRALGWANEMSTGQALRLSMTSMLSDAELGRLWR